MTARTATTLVEALDGAAAGPAELVFHLPEGIARIPAASLLVQARASAALLADRGVRPGDAVGVLGPNTPEWARWAYATWLDGRCWCPCRTTFGSATARRSAPSSVG